MQTEGQADRLADRWIDRQSDACRPIERHTYGQLDRNINVHTGKKAEIQTDIWADRQKYRDTGRQTEIQTYIRPKGQKYRHTYGQTDRNTDRHTGKKDRNTDRRAKRQKYRHTYG